MIPRLCRRGFRVSNRLYKCSMASKWGYKDIASWKDLPSCVSEGKRQSPIDITPSAVQKGANLIQLKLSGWNDEVSGSLTNNGHTVLFAPGANKAGLTNHLGSYIVQQFHFHWGRNRTEGSEHTVDGKQYSAEIHFVNLKEGLQGNSADGDAYSVVGVFCEEDDSVSENGVWEKLIIPSDYNQKVAIEGIKFKDLLPENLDYYYYEGSLTTPPCTEVVQWFVLKNPIKCPSSYLQKLRKIQTHEGECLSCNFRSVQKLNNRTVSSI